MRLARISAGGAAADAEWRRMVSEKMAAAAAAAATALAAGKGIETAAMVALALSAWFVQIISDCLVPGGSMRLFGAYCRAHLAATGR
jgi:hypothetical protein